MPFHLRPPVRIPRRTSRLGSCPRPACSRSSCRRPRRVDSVAAPRRTRGYRLRCSQRLRKRSTGTPRASGPVGTRAARNLSVGARRTSASAERAKRGSPASWRRRDSTLECRKARSSPRRTPHRARTPAEPGAAPALPLRWRTRVSRRRTLSCRRWTLSQRCCSRRWCPAIGTMPAAPASKSLRLASPEQCHNPARPATIQSRPDAEHC